VSPAALLAHLRGLGAHVAIVEGKLRCLAPAGTLTPELIATMLAHKAALLAVLRKEAAREAAGRWGWDFPSPPAPCTPEAIAWLRDLPRCRYPGCTLKRAAVMEWWPYCFEHAGDGSSNAIGQGGGQP
jgi:hypothetical protein